MSCFMLEEGDAALTTRRVSVHYAVCAWAVLFAAPHIWWALGLPYGMPGGKASHQLMMTSWWWYAYDVVVILCSILAVVLSLALLRPTISSRWRRRWRALAWIAFAMLSLRGVAGLIADGASDPIWWPMFLLGGLLFGALLR